MDCWLRRDIIMSTLPTSVCQSSLSRHDAALILKALQQLQAQEQNVESENERTRMKQLTSRLSMELNELQAQDEALAAASSSSPTPVTGPFAIDLNSVRAAAARIAHHVTHTPILTCSTIDRMVSEVGASTGAAVAASATCNTSSFEPVAPISPSPSPDQSSSSSATSSIQVYFKCEFLQKVGAFKFRGALNAVMKTMNESKADKSAQHPHSSESESDDRPQSTSNLICITHSSGNHAAALALSARLAGARSVIVMPSNSPAVKKAAVAGYGAQIVECEPNQSSREETAAQQMKLHAPHSRLIPPYDFPDVMAGQGTIALEFLQQVQDLDALVIPVGGGGMLSGMCIAAKGLNPRIRIYAAEPADADDAFESLTSIDGERVPLPKPTNTVADGLRTSLGIHPFPILRAHVSGVIRVSESEIVRAMRLVYGRMKVVIEPSAAVGVAAILSKQFHTTKHSLGRDAITHSEEEWRDVRMKVRDNNRHVTGMDGVEEFQPIRKVGVVLCGGNVDLDALPWTKQAK